jgi:hypothetical protein
VPVDPPIEDQPRPDVASSMKRVTVTT